jgi:multiple sugar transport system permease protein
MWTVPLGLRAFVDSMSGSSYGPLFAMSIVSLVPVFVFFILAQRQLVEGISTSGLKG